MKNGSIKRVRPAKVGRMDIIMKKIPISEGVYTVELDSPEEYVYCAERFYGEHTMVELRIPEGATALAYKGLAFCFKLKKLYLPQSVTYLGDSLLYGVDGTVDIYYSGTSEQFKPLGAPRRVKKQIRVSGRYDVQPYCMDEGNFYEEHEAWEAFDSFCREIYVNCSDGVRLRYGYKGASER